MVVDTGGLGETTGTGITRRCSATAAPAREVRTTDSHSSSERDRGLQRTASWTRATAIAATLLCAALAAGFAHVLPGHAAAQNGTAPSAPTRHRGDHTSRTPAQPPSTGSGAGQVTSGAS